MQRIHFRDDSGEDHLLQSARLMTDADATYHGKTFGKLQVTFHCCIKLAYVTPEEFAMSYSVHND